VSRKQAPKSRSTNDPTSAALDREIADVLATPVPSGGPASILVVAPESPRRTQLVDLLEDAAHRCICIGRLDTARSTIARGRFDLILVDPTLPDGSGFELMSRVGDQTTTTRIVVIGDLASRDDAVQAMRAGAVDVLATDLEPAELLRRVDAAVVLARVDRQREERLRRLKTICRELNTARHEITEQVDILSKDLVNVYQDMAEQMSEVAMTSEFRTLLRQELDIEDLLRTALQYMLTKTGPTNAVVFLPDADRNYGLGAYVNYDCPRESISVVLDHLGHDICPQMAREDELICFSDAGEFTNWIDADVEVFADSQIVAFSCKHRGECLAVVVLFRKKTEPYAENLAATLDTMRGIFAEQLSHIIKVHHRARPSWPSEAIDDDADYDGDDYGFGFEGGLAA
jgi:DNA-binding response OmpR family regulator